MEHANKYIKKNTSHTHTHTHTHTPYTHPHTHITLNDVYNFRVIIWNNTAHYSVLLSSMMDNVFRLVCTDVSDKPAVSILKVSAARYSHIPSALTTCYFYACSFKGLLQYRKWCNVEWQGEGSSGGRTEELHRYVSGGNKETRGLR
jgi:hypothetical protein